MPDALALSDFASFVLALLPRLLLYPGGLCALLAAAGPALRLRHAARERRGVPKGQAVAALALAWSGLALLPLPGASPLPGGPDLLGPLALLLAAGLLLHGEAADDERWDAEMAGRPLLVAAPLLVLGALGAPGLVLPITPHLRGPALPAVLLPATVAYFMGLLRCYGARGTPPWATGGGLPACGAAWLAWLGWVGVGTAVAWSAVGSPPLLPGAGPLLVLLGAAGLAGLLGSRAARAIAPQAATWGWMALAVALLFLLAAPVV